MKRALLLIPLLLPIVQAQQFTGQRLLTVASYANDAAANTACTAATGANCPVGTQYRRSSDAVLRIVCSSTGTFVDYVACTSFAAALSIGTVSGFDAVLRDSFTFQELYFDEAPHNIGLKNPAAFTQALLNVGIQDNTGNSQNTGLFTYVSSANSPTTVAYANGFEGDAWAVGTGTVSKLVGVTGYADAVNGTVTLGASVNAQTNQRGAATTGTLAGYYTFPLDIRAGTVTNAVGMHIGGVAVTGGTVTNSYGLYSTNAGGGTNNWNAYFNAGVVEVSASGSLRMTGPIEPGARVTGTKTLASASSYAFSVTPTLTTTGNADAYPVYLAPLITTPNSAATGSIQGINIQIPDITLGAGATLTSAMTMYLAGAPTEATSNYALYVDGVSALSRFAGNLRLDGNFTTQTSFAAGTLRSLGLVGTPSDAFTGDPNTGTWSSGADTYNFSTGGVERARIDSDGDLGIGDTSPSAKLEVGGGTSSDQVRIGDGGSNTYRIGRNTSNGHLDIEGTQTGFVAYNFKAGPIRSEGVAFASLPSINPGSYIWCTDCTIGSPCTGSGSGAWAFRVAGPAWNCPF